MQLERFSPAYEFRELHAINIDAPPGKVYQALKELTAAEISPLVSMMFELRSLPSRLIGKSAKGSFQPGPILDQLYRRGFVFLAEAPDCEIVFGLVGRFWEPSGKIGPVLSGPEAFLAFSDPTYAKGATNFLITARDGDIDCRCSTETRVYAPDPRTRRKFSFYWRIISMGSGLIRILLLWAIKHKAEKM